MQPSSPTASNPLGIAVQLKAQERLALFLSIIAGYVDAVGYMKWKTYVSFVSGNTTQAGFSLSQGNMTVVTAAFTGIASFTAGIYAGSCLSMWKRIKGHALLFGIPAAMMIIDMVLSLHAQVSTLLNVAIISMAMGVMNTIVTTIGNQAVNTDFVTGTLNSMAHHAAVFTMTTDEATRKQHKANGIRLLFLWLVFFAGAFLATFGFQYLGDWALGLPAMLLLVAPLTTYSINSYVTKK